jgi:hypothetical protein
MYPDQRGLRFAFNASADIAPKGSPRAFVPGRVTELSLQGCFVETSAKLDVHNLVLLKISGLDEPFEAEATVLYARATGVGLVFREIAPEFRPVLQKWMLKLLDSQLAPI